MDKGYRDGLAYRHRLNCQLVSQSILITRLYNYMDTHAFQGQWREHEAPLLQ